jgi:hypothetical protein
MNVGSCAWLAAPVLDPEASMVCSIRTSLFGLLLLCVVQPVHAAQDDEQDPPSVSDAVLTGVADLLKMQEAEPKRRKGDKEEAKEKQEWPYEGVYRVRGSIPYGYRVGGTSIAGSALLLAPGWDEDQERQEAVLRAMEFVASAIDEPLMDPDYSGGYDVRGWGYIYALDFLLLLERESVIPKKRAKAVRKAIGFYLKGLEEIEIPESGGWSYSRNGSLDKVSPTSPFMTGPALRSLFAAKAQGHKVDKKMVARALDALERGRVESGEVVYSSNAGSKASGGQLPGSVGRMLATETTLFLAERGSLSRVRGALDAFLVHWAWLDKRRARSGTHKKPYGVAPYYFYYAHFQAAQAIELLPRAEREEYRRRLRELLWSVRREDGTWNDRVFERTANYGTSIAVLCLVQPDIDPPAVWK